MSKTQKIILYIGVGLLLISLVLFLVNTILVKNKSADSGPVTPNTNLFSLFERSTTINTGDKNADEVTPDNTDTKQTGQSVLASQSNLQQVSERPVVNFLPTEKEVVEINFGQNTQAPQTKVKKIGVRYIGPDGIVYEKYDTEAESRISNTVSQRLGEAFLYKNSVVYRFSREDMQTIETFIGSISTKEGSLGNVVGSYLSKNIRSFAVNQDTGDYAAIISDEARTSAQIIVGGLEKSQSKQVSKTSFTDWLVDWVDKSTLALTSRPSEKTTSSFYTLNTVSGELKKVLSAQGLTTKALPFSAGVLLSYANNSVFETSLYANNKKTYLPFKTISDKCTATSKEVIICAVPKQGGYPSFDDWYKGEFNYSDILVSYNIQNGTQKIIYNGSGQVIDVDIIKSSADGSFVFFRNKINGFVYKIKSI